MAEVYMLVLQGMGELMGQGDPDVGGQLVAPHEHLLVLGHVQADDRRLTDLGLHGGQVSVAVDHPHGPHHPEQVLHVDLVLAVGAFPSPILALNLATGMKSTVTGWRNLSPRSFSTNATMLVIRGSQWLG